MKKFLILLAGLFVGFAAFAQDLDAQYATELLAPGTPAPEITLEDVSGNTVSLSSFQGRPVVLVFWASWCPDCRAEVPALKELRAAHPEVAFVSVSFDRTREAFESYVKDNGMDWTQLFDPTGMKSSPVGAAYHIKWIPSMYLIAPDGTISLGTVMLDKLAKRL